MMALAALCGCDSDEIIVVCPGCPDEGANPGNTPALFSPAIYATNASDPFTGVLEVYPCDAGTSTYFGNYYNDQKMVFNAFYNVSDGSIASSPRPIMLPVGQYSLLYWGVPQSGQGAAYPERGVKEPGLTLGGDLSRQYLSLRKSTRVGATTYMPVFDCVYCLRTVNVGSQSIAVPLKRAVAGLTVVLRKKDGSALDARIANITARIEPIASRLNFYTAEPDDFSKTVGFDMKIDQDMASASNVPVMVFPSGPDPVLTIILSMADGEEKRARMTLQNALDANTKLTVEVNMGEIFATETGGSGFEVDHWNEKSEKIDSGIFQ